MDKNSTGVDSNVLGTPNQYQSSSQVDSSKPSYNLPKMGYSN